MFLPVLPVRYALPVLLLLLSALELCYYNFRLVIKITRRQCWRLRHNIHTQDVYMLIRHSFETFYSAWMTCARSLTPAPAIQMCSWEFIFFGYFFPSESGMERLESMKCNGNRKTRGPILLLCTVHTHVCVHCALATNNRTTNKWKKMHINFAYKIYFSCWRKDTNEEKEEKKKILDKIRARWLFLWYMSEYDFQVENFVGFFFVLSPPPPWFE